MRWSAGLVLGVALAAAAGRADDPRDQVPPPKKADKKPDPPKKPAPKPDALPKAKKAPVPEVRDVLQKLQGTWPVESWEEGGKAAPDAAKRTVFFGGNVFLVRRDGKTLLAGPSFLNTGADPPAFDVTVREGDRKGDTLLGVYRLDGETLTLAYDPAGKARPTKLDPDPADGAVVVKLRRPKPPADEAVDIVGRYTSELVEATGKTVTTDAVIERRGDAYLVTYTVDGKLLFVGSALRKGSILSMCWVSSGQAGVSQYRIEKGPRLVGEYTTLAGIGVTGTEVLKPWRRVD